MKDLPDIALLAGVREIESSRRRRALEQTFTHSRGFPIVGVAAKCLTVAGMAVLAACSPVRAGHYPVRAAHSRSPAPAESIDRPDEARVDSTDPRAESSAGESGAPAREMTVSSELASPGPAEAQLFELLNSARKTLGLHPVAPDDELRQVALAHSKDMADHHFFSHVSPSTGQPGERVKRAGILVTQSAENIAQASTPQDAHEGLMDSPAHRAAMLEPHFTHVGIAAVVNAEGGLTVTMLLGRRPDPSDLPRSAAELEAALFAMRMAQGLTRPGVDLIYRTAARRGLLAYLQSPNPSPALLAQTVREVIQGEVDRLRSPRPTSCAHLAEFRDREQLERDPILTAPALVKFGLDAQVRTDAKGTRLTVVIVSEGVPCR